MRTLEAVRCQFRDHVGREVGSLHVVEVLLDGLESQRAVLDNLRLVPGTLQELHRDLLIHDVCEERQSRCKLSTRELPYCLLRGGP